MKKILLLLSFCAVCFLLACSSIYYATWEKLGYEKRDLLKSAISKTREEEVETIEQFKNALEALQATYGTQPSALQKFYVRVSGEYEDSKLKAGALKDRIRSLNKIASDLFKEWQSEANSITNATLRERSLSQRRDTIDRFATLRDTLQASEKQMDPVLNQMREYVLFLKHNLNAQSIGSLRQESHDIQMGMQRLTDSMKVSIGEMDQFLKSFEK
jgi:hypothetical protein